MFLIFLLDKVAADGVLEALLVLDQTEGAEDFHKDPQEVLP